MFKAKPVHASLLTLLKKDIKDERFVKASKTYGIDLISYAIQTPQIKKASLGLVTEVLCKDKRVI